MLFNLLMHLAIIAFSLLNLTLVYQTSIGKSLWTELEEETEPNGEEKLIRIGSFVVGIMVFLVAFSYVIPVKEIILNSLKEATTTVGVPIGVSSVLGLVCGVYASVYFIDKMKNRDVKSIRILLFVMGLLFSGVLYIYSVAWEVDTQERDLNPALLPSIFFIIGAILYAMLNYNTGTTVKQRGNKKQTSGLYVNAITVEKDKEFIDKETNFAIQIFDIEYQNYQNGGNCIKAYITLPEDKATFRKPMSLKVNQSMNYTSNGRNFVFTVEFFHKNNRVDIRILEK